MERTLSEGNKQKKQKYCKDCSKECTGFRCMSCHDKLLKFRASNFAGPVVDFEEKILVKRDWLGRLVK